MVEHDSSFEQLSTISHEFVENRELKNKYKNNAN